MLTQFIIFSVFAFSSTVYGKCPSLEGTYLNCNSSREGHKKVNLIVTQKTTGNSTHYQAYNSHELFLETQTSGNKKILDREFEGFGAISTLSEKSLCRANRLIVEQKLTNNKTQKVIFSSRIEVSKQGQRLIFENFIGKKLTDKTDCL